MDLQRLTLATYEPYNSIVHGNIDNGKLLVIYEYNLDDFYNNSWKGELKFYKKQIKNRFGTREHSLIRNYNKIMKKSNIELVEMCEVNNIMYCVLHTYKINILKRKWKNYRLRLHS
jgi:hypothetical protein